MKLILFMTLIAAVAQADFKATIYEKNSNKTKKLYTIENTAKENGEITEMTTVTKDANGEVVITEKGQVKGAELLSYEIEQKQLGETGRIQVQDSKINFSWQKGDKKKQDDEKLEKNFAGALSFVRFVQKNWGDLSKDQTIDIRYGVWDRLETVGFTLKKVSEDKTAGTAKIQMKPTSFAISLLVDPIYFTFTQDGSKLLELVGRVAPKIKVGSSWKDLDAEVIYE